ncbi:MAG TPA: PHP domain-containing protein [Thermoanaerobaculia bacterium]|nr:PHP domain-containing protein [Thermoanaerobaculia bacterium]
MTKFDVARILSDIASYIELGGTNPFRARAFERAAREIEKLDDDIEALVDSGAIYDVPGIGKSIGAIIEEIVRTGGSRYLEELRSHYPPGVFDLLRVPGLGLRKIGQIHSELGIASLEELEAAARAGRLAPLKGFGPKTQQKILDGIALARNRSHQILLPAGIDTGELLREQLASIAVVEDVEISGSVRRKLEVVRNVDIAIAAKDPEKAFAAIEKRKLASGFTRVDEAMARGIVHGEIEVRFHVSAPERFGLLLLTTTGTTAFVDAFLSKLERPLEARTERELFEKGGIPFVEPELRESAEALKTKKRPRLIEPGDLRGTFHVHTTYSDGRNTLLEMLTAARESGLEYVGISDHSKSAFYASGLTEEQLARQQREIDRHRAAVAPLRVFRGSEADILADGSIDYGPATLATLDFVVASIHSRFGMSRDEMTARILRALDDPHVTFLGHPTGRLLLSREGYSIDFDRIFDRAAERGVIIEINGNPRRAELDWRHLRRAVDRGVMLSIHPDAHSIAEFRHVVSGTWVARKGGLTAKEVFNARPADEVEEYLRKRKGAARG